MIVMKFGGASLTDAFAVQNAINIIKERLDLQPVIVASAMGKTTRKLLNAAENATNDALNESLKILNELKKNHTSVYLNFCNNNNLKPKANKIEKYFIELHLLLQQIATDKQLNGNILDKILSYGELISTSILVSCLKLKNIKSKWIDARSCIITDDSFSKANPNKDISYENIRKNILPELTNGYLPVTQGFIGSTISGKTTTLGFEGSDFSAVLIGAALEATEIQFWKNVPGIMTGDPDVITKPFTVNSMTFAEAAELSYRGSKILHHRTIEPARAMNIPLHIYNSNEPDLAKTIIKSRSIDIVPSIKSITHKSSLVIFKVTSKNIINDYDFLAHIFNLCQKKKLVPFAVYGSSQILHLIFESSGRLNNLIEELKSFTSMDMQNNISIISLVGENVNQNIELKVSLQNEINNYYPEISLIDISPHSFTFIVDDNKASLVLTKIHDYIFNNIN